ncbi:MAG: hypothetical protein WBR13_02135 [Allosphingosinicella sp.]
MNRKWLIRVRKWLGRALQWVMGRPAWLIRQSAEGWVAIATLLQAAILAYAGWVAYDQWTSDKAMELQKKWTSPTMEALRSRVDDALLCKALFVQRSTGGASQELDMIDPNSLSADQRYEFYLKIIYPSDHYRGLIEDFSSFNDFYDSVNNCVESGVCNEKTSCLLFGQKAIDLARNFGPYFARQQAIFSDRAYGTDIGQMAERCAAQLDSNSRSRSWWPWSEDPEDKRLGEEALIAAFRDELRNELKAAEGNYITGQRQAACDRMTPAAVEARNQRAAQAEREMPDEE